MIKKKILAISHCFELRKKNPYDSESGKAGTVVRGLLFPHSAVFPATLGGTVQPHLLLYYILCSNLVSISCLCHSYESLTLTCNNHDQLILFFITKLITTTFQNKKMEIYTTYVGITNCIVKFNCSLRV